MDGNPAKLPTGFGTLPSAPSGSGRSVGEMAGGCRAWFYDQGRMDVFSVMAEPCLTRIGVE